MACEAFLFADEVAWQQVYGEACSTIGIAPADSQEGPDDLAPAPDGKARSATEESITQSAVGYLSALSETATRGQRACFLFAAPECLASGGAADTCEDAFEGAPRRAVPQPRVGADDVPARGRGRAVSGLPPGPRDDATVKRRGNPCGPGCDLTLVRGEKRYAIISPEPAAKKKKRSAGRLLAVTVIQVSGNGATKATHEALMLSSR